MSQVKLFSSTGTRVARRSGKPKKQKVKKPLKTLAIWLLVILCLEALYFFCVYTNNSFVKKWRTIYINTAMDTMRHQWLATYFIPKDESPNSAACSPSASIFRTARSLVSSLPTTDAVYS